MDPRLSLSIWLFAALGVAGISFLIAFLDNRRWTVEWIGDSVKDMVARHAVGAIVIVLLHLNYEYCLYACNPWLSFTTVLLYLLAIVGWPLSALFFSAAYLMSSMFWGGVLGIRYSLGANLFQFIFYLLSLAFVFLHLRDRLQWIALIPLPSPLIELSDRTKRAWRAMGQQPVQTVSAAQAEPLRVQSQSATPKQAAPASPQAVVPQRSVPPTRRVPSASFAASDLYLFTLVIEGGAALVRSLFFFATSLVTLSPLYIFLFINSQWRYYQEVQTLFGTTQTYDYARWFTDNLGRALLISAVVGLVIGCWPLVRSLFHVLFPYTRSGAGEDERDALGAREPTRAEHQKIIDTLELIQSSAAVQPVAPSYWLVIDAPTPDAYTIGSTVYVTSAAIEDKHFAGIMAHELGHIAHKDGDLILALRRFVIPLAYFIGVDRQPTPAGTIQARGTGISVDVIRNEDEKIFYRFKALEIKLMLAFWTGGMGLFFLGRAWARFWRKRDFLADEYAVQLGQADSLMGILRTYRHSDVAQPFLLSSRPYTAERLDRLQG